MGCRYLQERRKPLFDGLCRFFEGSHVRSRSVYVRIGTRFFFWGGLNTGWLPKLVQTVFSRFQIWSRFGPDWVQIEVDGCPDQKIWTACPDMLSRFWTGPDHSGLVQTEFSYGTSTCFIIPIFFVALFFDSYLCRTFEKKATLVWIIYHWSYV
mgnify:CR=1 FL=1